MELDPAVAASDPEQLGARESTASAVSVQPRLRYHVVEEAPKSGTLFLALEQ